MKVKFIKSKSVRSGPQTQKGKSRLCPSVVKGSGVEFCSGVGVTLALFDRKKRHVFKTALIGR